MLSGLSGIKGKATRMLVPSFLRGGDEKGGDHTAPGTPGVPPSLFASAPTDFAGHAAQFDAFARQLAELNDAMLVAQSSVDAMCSALMTVAEKLSPLACTHAGLLQESGDYLNAATLLDLELRGAVNKCLNTTVMVPLRHVLASHTELRARIEERNAALRDYEASSKEFATMQRRQAATAAGVSASAVLGLMGLAGGNTVDPAVKAATESARLAERQAKLVTRLTVSQATAAALTDALTAEMVSLATRRRDVATRLFSGITSSHYHFLHGAACCFAGTGGGAPPPPLSPHRPGLAAAAAEPPPLLASRAAIGLTAVVAGSGSRLSAASQPPLPSTPSSAARATLGDLPSHIRALASLTDATLRGEPWWDEGSAARAKSRVESVLKREEQRRRADAAAVHRDVPLAAYKRGSGGISAYSGGGGNSSSALFSPMGAAPAVASLLFGSAAADGAVGGDGTWAAANAEEGTGVRGAGGGVVTTPASLPLEGAPAVSALPLSAPLFSSTSVGSDGGFTTSSSDHLFLPPAPPPPSARATVLSSPAWLARIAQGLTVADLCAMGRVCTAWAAAVSTEQDVWLSVVRGGGVVVGSPSGVEAYPAAEAASARLRVQLWTRALGVDGRPLPAWSQPYQLAAARSNARGQGSGRLGPSMGGVILQGIAAWFNATVPAPTAAATAAPAAAAVRAYGAVRPATRDEFIALLQLARAESAAGAKADDKADGDMTYGGTGGSSSGGGGGMLGGGGRDGAPACRWSVMIEQDVLRSYAPGIAFGESAAVRRQLQRLSAPPPAATIDDEGVVYNEGGRTPSLQPQTPQGQAVGLMMDAEGTGPRRSQRAAWQPHGGHGVGAPLLLPQLEDYQSALLRAHRRCVSATGRLQPASVFKGEAAAACGSGGGAARSGSASLRRHGGPHSLSVSSPSLPSGAASQTMTLTAFLKAAVHGEPFVPPSSEGAEETAAAAVGAARGVLLPVRHRRRSAPWLLLGRLAASPLQWQPPVWSSTLPRWAAVGRTLEPPIAATQQIATFPPDSAPSSLSETPSPSPGVTAAVAAAPFSSHSSSESSSGVGGSGGGGGSAEFLDAMVLRRRGELRRILLAVAAAEPGLRYTQGMNSIARMLLEVCAAAAPTEEGESRLGEGGEKENGHRASTTDDDYAVPDYVVTAFNLLRGMLHMDDGVWKGGRSSMTGATASTGSSGSGAGLAGSPPTLGSTAATSSPGPSPSPPPLPSPVPPGVPSSSSVSSTSTTSAAAPQSSPTMSPAPSAGSAGSPASPATPPTPPPPTSAAAAAAATAAAASASALSGGSGGVVSTPAQGPRPLGTGLLSLFAHDMTTLRLRLYQADRLILRRLPALHSHMAGESMNTAAYAAPWLLTLFSNFAALDGPRVAQLWDRFVVGGWPEVLSVLLSVLDALQPVLLGAPMEDMMRVLAAPLAFYAAPQAGGHVAVAQPGGGGNPSSSVRFFARLGGNGVGRPSETQLAAIMRSAASRQDIVVSAAEARELETDFMSLPPASRGGGAPLF